MFRKLKIIWMALDASILMFTRDGFAGISTFILKGDYPFYVGKSSENGERMPVYLRSEDIIDKDPNLIPKYGTDSIHELFLILGNVL